MNPLLDKYAAFRQRLATQHDQQKRNHPNRKTHSEISQEVAQFLENGGTIQTVTAKDNALAKEVLLADYKLRYKRAGGCIKDPEPSAGTAKRRVLPLNVDNGAMSYRGMDFFR